MSVVKQIKQLYDISLKQLKMYLNKILALKVQISKITHCF